MVSLGPSGRPSRSNRARVSYAPLDNGSEDDIMGGAEDSSVNNFGSTSSGDQQDEGDAMKVDTSSDGESTAPAASSSARRKNPASTKLASKAKKSTVSLPTARTKPVSRSKQSMLSLIPGNTNEIDITLPPMSDIGDIFRDITEKACTAGLDDVLKKFPESRPLRIATMCSGTESPLLALEMVRDALIAKDKDLHIDHLFSAEIEPFKQAYIERNFHPPIIFRDIVELLKDAKVATTAYGAMAEVPKDVDILVAGTSCVDFSNLNRKKRGLSSEGESGDTFNSVLEYVKESKPTIVVLENVYSAPWDDMLSKYEAEGYLTKGVLVDTKDFYLPHTRRRGYMFCVKKPDKDIPDWDPAAHWAKLMQHFKRPASSPVSSFLQTNDHANVIRSRQRMANQETFIDDTREVDWGVCELRHIKYRQEQKLGNSRPMTSWQPSGVLVIPDFADKSWFTKQVERVWDMADCSLLRKALPKAGQYDVYYKTRIWNVSQNVDRFVDTSPAGVTSCITPNGIFYVSDRGGPLTATECLSLQGLPLNKINITKETSGQLQDLAGNAMSSTVIGSAIISALIAALPAIQSGHAKKTDKKALHKEAHAAMRGENNLVELNTLHQSQQLDLNELVHDAESSARKCSCEGQIGVVEKPLQLCEKCGHSTCTACGKKPSHHYVRQPKPIETRQTPTTFTDKWRPRIPMSVHFEHFDSSNFVEDFHAYMQKQIATPNLLTAKYIDIVEKATKDAFHFSRFDRRSRWTIVYDSHHAQLQLVIQNDRVEWLLFAKADENLPGNDALRKFLEQPIGKAEVGSEIYDTGNWKWRVPCNVNFLATIVGVGDRVKSWGARLDMKDASTPAERVWSKLNIDIPNMLEKDVSGTYNYLPKCGTACESLYKRESDAGEAPIYLLLDPDRIGLPQSDKFVFSSDPSRLEYDQHRQVFACIEANWRPWNCDAARENPDEEQASQGGDNNVKGKNKSKVQTGKGKKSKKQTGKGETLTVRRNLIDPRNRPDTFSKPSGSSDGSWITGPKTALTTQLTNTSIRCLPNPDDLLTAAIGQNGCSSATALVVCELPKDANTEKLSFGPRIIRPNDEDEFYNTYGWSLELSRQPLTVDWTSLVPLTQDADCKGCAPPVPDLRWTRVVNGKITKIKAFEEPVSATMYEQALKNRPNIFVTETVKDNGIPSFKLGLNLLSLVQRAYTKLQATKRAHDVSVAWRLDTSYTEASASKLPPFKLMPNDPALVYNPDEHFGKKLKVEELFIKQKQSLAWMRSQEAGEGRRFVIEEAEEALLPSLGWRAEARVQTSVHIRGGILADHAGFGKTITTLALIHSEFEELDSDGIRSMMESSQPSEKVPAPMVSTATLIVCPKTLFIQWKEEMTKVLPDFDVESKLDLVALDSVKDLVKYTKDDIRDTRIVLANEKLLASETYTAAMASFAGVPKAATGAGRDLQPWLEYATKQVLEHMQIDNPKTLIATIRKKIKDHEQSDIFETFVPSQRLKGAKRDKASSNKDTQDKSKKIVADSGVVVKPNQVLLQMFKFNRIVVDEFTYLDKRSLAVINSLEAVKRWALSATPALRDPYDIAYIASLLGLKLRIGDNTSGVISSGNASAMQDEMTDVEKFRSLQEPYSHAMHARIYEIGQMFLDAFVRQNVQTFEDFAYCDYIIPVTLDIHHRMVYAEHLEQLNSQDMRLRKSTKEKAGGNDRGETFSATSMDASSPEEILSKAAACCPTSAVSSHQFRSHESFVELREIQLEKANEELQKSVVDSYKKDCRIDKKGKEFPFKTWVIDIINEGTLGDDETKNVVIDMIKSTAGSGYISAIQGSVRDEAEVVPDNDEADESTAAQENDASNNSPVGQARLSTSETNQSAKKYRTAARSLRFAQSVVDLVSPAYNHDEQCHCHDSKCDPTQLGVSSLCGHIVCRPCLELIQEGTGVCGAEGCGAPVKAFHIMWASKIENAAAVFDENVAATSTPDSSGSLGNKVKVLMDHLVDVQKQKAKAILFVQTEEQLRQMARALHSRGVRYTAIETENLLSKAAPILRTSRAAGRKKAEAGKDDEISEETEPEIADESPEDPQPEMADKVSEDDELEDVDENTPALVDKRSAATKIEDFKKDTNATNATTVIVLNASNVSAAGM